MVKIKFYVPYRGMLEVHEGGQGTYVSWKDYQAPIHQVEALEMMACGRHAEDLVSAYEEHIRHKERAEKAEARIEELQQSMIRHFHDKHIMGDGPEIDRWKIKLKKAEADSEDHKHKLWLYEDKLKKAEANLATLKEMVQKFIGLRRLVNMKGNIHDVLCDDLEKGLDSLNLNPKEEIK